MAKAKPNFTGFEPAQLALNEDRAYRSLGSTDMNVAFAIGDIAQMVTFDAFEISRVHRINTGDLRDADLIVEMPVKDWNAYLRKRKSGSGPSLLSLDLASGGEIVQAANSLQRLKFERYNRSLQTFIDKGAELSE